MPRACIQYDKHHVWKTVFMTIGYLITNVSKRAPSIPHIAQAKGEGGGGKQCRLSYSFAPTLPVTYYVQAPFGFTARSCACELLSPSFQQRTPLERERRKKSHRKGTEEPDVFEALKVSWGRRVTNKKKKKKQRFVIFCWKTRAPEQATLVLGC